MKAILMATALAVLFGGSAFAQSPGQARGTAAKTQASDEPGFAWRGYGAVTTGHTARSAP